MTEALKPDFYVNSAAEVDSVAVNNATPEEILLASLSRARGWKHFRALAKDAIEGLNRTNRQAVANGLSVEEIGRNTVVLFMAQGVIEALFNKVDDAVEACNKDA